MPTNGELSHSTANRLTLQASLAVLLFLPTILPAAELRLAVDGESDYQIVGPESASAVDGYAMRILADYVKQITGAELSAVAPDAMTGDEHSIFVGLSTPAIKRLDKDPLDNLKDQEHVARSIGGDIFLYGKGVHGNLHAVMEFLENSLGWRWFSVYSIPVIPSKATLTLTPFDRRRGFSFAFREVGLRHGLDFYYQNGINMGFDRSIRSRQRYNLETPAGIIPLKPNEKFVHSSFAYIPPSPDTVYAKTFDWLKRKDYFQTHPEFFSMNASGRRVNNRQLCFGNQQLRQELTRNILQHIALAGEDNIITLDAADNSDKFCYCPACQALEKKHGSPGGPIYDYLFELCGLLKARHPGVMVKTLAYRRSQTQKPPVLPPGERLPDNLIIAFAPIEDSYFADWTHSDPRIQETYHDLLAWGKITSHLWAWLYPNPWGSGSAMPVGNVERIVKNVRLMHQAGVTGVFSDHNGFFERAGWSELQSYLLYKLMQDVNCDADAVTEEFTDHHYGAAAAPLVRQYLAELEQGRQEMTVLPGGTTYRSQEYDERTFPYLTLENIRRWQASFDQMEERTAGRAEQLLNVRTLRRELDFATLWRWLDLQKRYPDDFKDHTVYADRITAVNKAKAPAGMQPRPLGKSTLAEFLAVIQGGGREKPLPAAFDGIDRSQIKTFVPTNKGRQPGPKLLVDPQAARGFACTVHLPDLPFQFGFYQWESRQPPRGHHGPRVRLERNDITPGAYRLYELGTITVTPDCLIWFSAKSWLTNIELGERLYEPGEDNCWKAYVSLRFDGPAYGGKAKENQVLCDRVVLVKDPGRNKLRNLIGPKAGPEQARK